MSEVLAIRHVEFEHLGMMEKVLKELGYSFMYLDTPSGAKLNKSLEEFSLIVVLGGYMGAYEEEKYPFLSYEFKLMEEALKKEIPLLGICLGAQMLAKVLGAKVYPGDKGKEIGWYEITKVGEHPYFEEFPKKLKVLQWHGDTFDLPADAVRIFSSEKYPNQAFVYNKAVGLQFHIEVDKELLKTWINAYKKEVEKEGLNPEKILTDAKEEEIELLFNLCKSFLTKFLKK